MSLAIACVPSLARADKGEQAQVDPATRDKSRAAFKKGVAQLKAQDWKGARASFEDAYSLVPHPSILLNLGVSRLKTDDPAGAEEALTKFLQEDSGAGSDELASARDALAEARGKLGTIHFNLTPTGAKTTVDGKEASGTDVRVKAGSHAIVIESEGFQSAEKQVDVPAKGTIEVQAVLAKTGGAATDKPKEEKKEVSTDDGTTRKYIGYGLLGAAGLALIITGIEGVSALSAASDYKTETDPAKKKDLKDSGEGARTIADISLILGLLAGAGGVILLFTDIGKDTGPAKPDAPKPEPPKAAIRYQFPATLRW
jgi:hypothetical protein